jgi:SulP family sulfate permease
LLLVKGALGMMTGASLGEALTQPPLIAKWLPGLAFAVIMIIILRRNSHFLVVPSLILGGVGIFFLTLLVSGTPLSAADAGGWMVSAGPGGTLWNPVSIAALRGANWGFVFSHVGSLLSVTVVVLLSLLLNASAIELETKQEIDLNRELKVLGLANVLAGLGASPAGGPYLGSTTLVKRMGASTRLVGVAQAMVAGIILFAGASLLGYIPKFVLGGLVLYFGLSFLLRWVWDSRAELPTADYVVILMILGVIFVFGFIPGVAVGIVLAVVLFVVNYSRINVIKHQLSGVNHQSTVERPTLYRDLLRRKGHWLYMLKLQGFIFFGTANTLFNQFRARIEAPDRQKPRFFLLDFRLVTGVDSSAMLSFRKMLQLAETHHILLIFTSLSEVMEGRLSHAPFAALKGVRWMSFPDLDYGMEWYEDQVIKNFESVGFGVKPPTMTRQLQKLLPDREAVRKMMGYFIEMKVESGTTLVDQGEAPKGIWFIEEGQVTVELVVHDERTIRLRTLNSGTAIGELGVYMNIPTTAKVIAVRPASLFFLSTESLGDMEKNAPELAAAFHRFMAHTIAERLVTAGETMKVLLS